MVCNELAVPTYNTLLISQGTCGEGSLADHVDVRSAGRQPQWASGREASGRKPERSPRRSHSDEALLARFRSIHDQLHGDYGWPRMHKELLARGVRVGKE